MVTVSRSKLGWTCRWSADTHGVVGYKRHRLEDSDPGLGIVVASSRKGPCVLDDRSSPRRGLVSAGNGHRRDHGLVFYNHDYDNPELMAVKLGGKGDVTDSNVVWRTNRGAPSTPSPLLVGDELYSVSDKGIASSVNAKTGELHWMERLEGDFSASPIFANDCILFLNETGVSTWVRTGMKFEIRGSNEVPGRTFATPAFSEGAMYLRTDVNLYKVSQ